MISSQDRHIIVNYHYVEDPKPDWGGIHPCSVDEFERQISFLSKNFEIVSVDQVYVCVNKKPQGRFCAITFDDGLRGQYENALPVLNRYKVRGTFFPITSTFEGRLPATHKVHVLLSRLSPAQLTEIFHKFLDEFYPDLRQVYNVPLDRRLFERREHEDIVAANFKETMIGLPDDIKNRFLRFCFKKIGLDEAALSRQVFMTPGKVVELCRQKMAMGSHSHGHYSMAAVDLEFMKKDVQLSKDILTKMSGQEITVFSYSHGHNSVTGLKILTDLGFKHAVTIERRSLSRGDNPLLLPRYDTNDLRDFINNTG